MYMECEYVICPGCALNVVSRPGSGEGCVQVVSLAVVVMCSGPRLECDVRKAGRKRKRKGTSLDSGLKDRLAVIVEERKFEYEEW